MEEFVSSAARRLQLNDVDHTKLEVQLLSGSRWIVINSLSHLEKDDHLQLVIPN